MNDPNLHNLLPTDSINKLEDSNRGIEQFFSCVFCLFARPARIHPRRNTSTKFFAQQWCRPWLFDVSSLSGHLYHLQLREQPSLFLWQGARSFCPFDNQLPQRDRRDAEIMCPSMKDCMKAPFLTLQLERLQKLAEVFNNNQWLSKVFTVFNWHASKWILCASFGLRDFLKTHIWIFIDIMELPKTAAYSLSWVQVHLSSALFLPSQNCFMDAIQETEHLFLRWLPRFAITRNSSANLFMPQNWRTFVGNPIVGG